MGGRVSTTLTATEKPKEVRVSKVRSFYRCQDDTVCAWNPVQDILAASSVRKGVRIWNLTDGEEGDHLIHAETHFLYRDSPCLDWNPEGSRIATGGNHGYIFTEEGRHLVTLDTSVPDILNKARFQQLSWSPTGDCLLAVTKGSVKGVPPESKITLWDPGTGECREEFRHDGWSVSSNAHWRNNESFAVAWNNGSITLLERGQPKPKMAFVNAHGSKVKWNRSGELLASITKGDKSFKIWSTASAMGNHKALEPSSEVRSLDWSPSEDALIATGSAKGTLVHIWNCHAMATRNPQNGPSPLSSFEGYDSRLHSPIYAVSFAPNGKLLAAGSKESLRLWDISSNQLIRKYSINRRKSPVGHLSWNGRGDKIAACIDILNIETRAELFTVDLRC